MIDITDCRDLLSLQAVLFMVIFLQSSAKLSTCYSYVGIALRSALRMGMHRSVAMQFNPIDREVRKRLFWMIRKMDTYVGAQLGLPEMLNDDDIDQEDPMEVDDEYITLDGILPMPEGKLSMITATNAHSRLVVVLTKVIKYIYPIKGETRVDGKTSETYVVSQSLIREIERDLQEWMDKLPMQLRTGGEASPELARSVHRSTTPALGLLAERSTGSNSSSGCPTPTRRWCCTAPFCITSRSHTPPRPSTRAPTPVRRPASACRATSCTSRRR